MIALPPAARGRTALRITAAAAQGRFELQVCEACGDTQYPPREVCGRCLSTALRWKIQSGAGTLLAATTLRHSNDEYFRERLPWKTGLVRLQAGPTLIVHTHQQLSAAPADVRVIARLDRSGQAVLIALPKHDDANLRSDMMLQEMGCDPASRAVLISDGESELGQSLTRALAGAGAAKIWVGHSKCIDSVAMNPPSDVVEYVSLNVTDPDSLAALAARIGCSLDIVINTHDAELGNAAADAEMQINYFGALNLANAFAPLLRHRAAQRHLCAWVNLLSIDALCSSPARASYSASKAAAHSMTQNLRRDLRADGIRVLGIYPSPPGALGPDALAADIVGALRDGVEDLFEGPIAQAWSQGFCESPKVLEREIMLAAVAR